MARNNTLKVTVKEEAGKVTYSLVGIPTIQHLARLEKKLVSLEAGADLTAVSWDFSRLEKMDTALAMLITKHNRHLEECGCKVAFIALDSDIEKMLKMTRDHAHFNSDFEPQSESVLTLVGSDTIERMKKLGGFFAFFGQMSFVFLYSFSHLKHMRWKETVFEMYESGIKALPIIALTMFLVGVVVAYQSAAQLKIYGANIFIVDMLGISILRELAPMLAAIIVAGRSGSSYAAQIGVMKITEELDAMRTMGFDPYAFLVLPRMLALMIMMPILIFFADISGVIGGMLIAKIDLGLSPSLFLDRFIEVVKVKHFWIGLIKGPFFALLIATIGIYRGLQVKNDTQSIGFNTTKAVVEAIFAVIICDAFFSIVFTNLGY